MHKERLELFSDGVFAIVLTLLVLELKVPHAKGYAVFVEAGPGLAVHALTFFVIGMAWVSHHNLVGHLTAVSRRTLLLNLLYLFFLTLLPFGAKMAAEEDWSPAAAALLCGCTAMGTICLIAIAQSGTSSIILTPEYRRVQRGRFALGAVVVGSGLACAALSFISAWFGYLYLVVAYGMVPFLRSPLELEQTTRELAREGRKQA